MVKKKSDTEITIAQVNEFELNKMGFYCKVRTSYNKSRGKNDFLFDIITYNNNEEVIVKKGSVHFPIGELEAIKERDKIIEFYLNKVKNEK